jgi:hypothetical protein
MKTAMAALPVVGGPAAELFGVITSVAQPPERTTSDAAPVEEHLLVCEECRARLAGWDAYVRTCVRRAPGRTGWNFQCRSGG